MATLSLSVKRKLAQLIAALLLNGNFKGFAEGTIYSGKLKQICVPGLNCYSCPGALGACPLGALQTMLADPAYKMSFYVLGSLLAVGMVAGRWVCGWICPFGFFQELLRAPAKAVAKRRAAATISIQAKPAATSIQAEPAASRRQALVKPAASQRQAPAGPPLSAFRAPFFLRYAKYVLLVLLVILFPLFLTDRFGFGAPYFCEWICPSGTIFGALPLLPANPQLAGFIGPLFFIKITAAALIVAGSIVSNRFFCKYLCPLGAIFGLFNRVALTRLVFSRENCVSCGKCTGACSMGGMDIDPRAPGQRMECICCGKCVKTCDYGALHIETPKSFFARKALD